MFPRSIVWLLVFVVVSTSAFADSIPAVELSCPDIGGWVHGDGYGQDGMWMNGPTFLESYGQEAEVGCRYAQRVDDYGGVDTIQFIVYYQTSGKFEDRPSGSRYSYCTGDDVRKGTYYSSLYHPSSVIMGSYQLISGYENDVSQITKNAAINLMNQIVKGNLVISCPGYVPPKPPEPDPPKPPKPPGPDPPEPTPDFLELPQYMKDEINLVYTLYIYFSMLNIDEEQADLYYLRLLQLHKEAAQLQGYDPAEFDIFALLVPLKIEQTSMSREEKAQRLFNAKTAYKDLLLDQYRYEDFKYEGVDLSELLLRISDKRSELKSEYGRVLLFDPDNIEANTALANLYEEEGRNDDAKIFRKRALINLAGNNPDAYNKIKQGMERQKEDTRKYIGAPNLPGSSFIVELGRTFDQAVKDVQQDFKETMRDIEIWTKSIDIGEKSASIKKKINEAIFSISEEKIDGAAYD